MVGRNTELHLHCVLDYSYWHAKQNTLSALQPPDNVYTSSLNTSPTNDTFSERFRHLSQMDLRLILRYVAFHYTN
jgi:hypothetical protein